MEIGELRGNELAGKEGIDEHRKQLDKPPRAANVICRPCCEL